MKRISWRYSNRRKGDNAQMLHIETDLGIINVHVGLHNMDGDNVEAIEILADDGVVLLGSSHSRLLKYSRAIMHAS